MDTRWTIALVTDPDHPGLRPDDIPLPDAFAQLGATAIPVPWGRSLPSERFDLAVVRTPWDYFLRAPSFLDWVAGLSVPLLNAPDVLRWNHDKRYLVDLAERGVAKIPRTLVLAEDERPTSIDAELDRMDRPLAVLKPTVSGGGHRTRIVRRGDEVQWSRDDEGAFLLQELVAAVEERGEWSLVFFGGEYSHAVRKAAREGEFRVQEEHGGRVLHEEAPSAVRRAAAEVLAGLPFPRPLPYARVDLVEAYDGGVLLMELELIEPELFFRVDERAPSRFAQAVLEASRSTPPPGPVRSTRPV